MNILKQNGRNTFNSFDRASVERRVEAEVFVCVALDFLSLQSLDKKELTGCTETSTHSLDIASNVLLRKLLRVSGASALIGTRLFHYRDFTERFFDKPRH